MSYHCSSYFRGWRVYCMCEETLLDCGMYRVQCTLSVTHQIQGARGIDARFLELLPASAVSPILTKFSQYTPHSTCYSEPVFTGKIKGPSTGESERRHCQNNPRRMREDGEKKFKKQGI
jgi:hypothetical protein